MDKIDEMVLVHIWEGMRGDIAFREYYRGELNGVYHGAVRTNPELAEAAHFLNMIDSNLVIIEYENAYKKIYNTYKIVG